MSNLTLTATWHDDINQVEPNETITGGTNGNANLATKQLGDNCKYLKQKHESLEQTVSGLPTSTGSSVTVNNSLTSDSTTQALSAKQGKVLKGMIDDITVPTVNNSLTSDSTTQALSAAQGKALKQLIQNTQDMTSPSGSYTVQFHQETTQSGDNPRNSGMSWSITSVIGRFAPTITKSAGGAWASACKISFPESIDDISNLVVYCYGGSGLIDTQNYTIDQTNRTIEVSVTSSLSIPFERLEVTYY